MRKMQTINDNWKFLKDVAQVPANLPENAEKPRNQATSGLLVHIGFVSKIGI